MLKYNLKYHVKGTIGLREEIVEAWTPNDAWKIIQMRYGKDNVKLLNPLSACLPLNQEDLEKLEENKKNPPKSGGHFTGFLIIAAVCAPFLLAFGAWTDHTDKKNKEAEKQAAILENKAFKIEELYRNFNIIVFQRDFEPQDVIRELKNIPIAKSGNLEKAYALQNEGVTLFKAGEKGKASHKLKAAVTECPAEAQIRTNYAFVLYSMNSPEALNNIKIALTLDPSNKSAWKLLIKEFEKKPKQNQDSIKRLKAIESWINKNR